MSWDASMFANAVVRELQKADTVAAPLDVRARGKTATVGLLDAGEWVPLLRFSRPSASFNVMSLDVRQGSRWTATHVRGVPAAIAEELLGGLRFTWAMEAEATEWQDISDREH